MSTEYRAIGWNPFKKRYDAVLVAAVIVGLAIFVASSIVSARADKSAQPEAVVIRGLGAVTVLLLHAVLWVGPLARLHRGFLPLLYNRRHLGVCTFLIASLHGVLSLGYYHGFGVVSPVESFVKYARGPLPFEWLGAAALSILLLLAATSHDFWNRTLGPVAWKWLHMSAYLAYAFVVLHVLLGSGFEQPLLRLAVMVGVAVTCTLHLVAGFRSVRGDGFPSAETDGWIDAGLSETLAEGRARNINIPGGAVAVCRHEGKMFAVGGRCAHQGGPLGEGRVIDGCLTCPWHGWQYRPEDGASPPPFTEQLPVFQVRVVGDRIQILPRVSGIAAAPLEEDQQ